MIVKTRNAQSTGFTCLFINTKIGLVGYTPITKNNPIVELNTNDPNFNFNVIGLKGTHYNYYNSVQKNIIKHHVVTGNTHRQGLTFSAIGTNEPIYKKDEQREFFGKVKAWLYRANGSSENWWVFGKTIPDKLVMQPKKNIGIFGVGYHYADKGLFIILQLESQGSNQFESEILKLEDVPNCFDASSFRIVEENEVQDAILKQEDVKQKIDEQISKNSASNNPCKELKEKTLRQNKKLTEVTQNMMKAIQQGRQQQSMQLQVQKDIEQQQAIVDDYNEKICKKEAQISRSQNSSSSQRYIQEKACLQQNLNFETEKLNKFKTIQEAHLNEPAKAIQLILQTRQQQGRIPCLR